MGALVYTSITITMDLHCLIEIHFWTNYEKQYTGRGNFYKWTSAFGSELFCYNLYAKSMYKF